MDISLIKRSQKCPILTPTTTSASPTTEDPTNTVYSAQFVYLQRIAAGSYHELHVHFLYTVCTVLHTLCKFSHNLCTFLYSLYTFLYNLSLYIFVYSLHILYTLCTIFNTLYTFFAHSSYTFCTLLCTLVYVLYTCCVVTLYLRILAGLAVYKQLHI